jgi:cytochrome b561
MGADQSAYTAPAWGSAAKCLHWLIAALIVVQVPAGYLMSYTYGLAIHAPSVQPLQTLFAQIHHSIGLLCLPLVAGRLFWRNRVPHPVSPGIARANHALLYALLIVLPLSGWEAVSLVAGEPIWLFGLHMPGLSRPVPIDSPYGYGLFARIHIYAAYAGAALLGLHVAAAFWHLLVRRDGVFRGMWPLAGDRAKS